MVKNIFIFREKDISHRKLAFSVNVSLLQIIVFIIIRICRYATINCYYILLELNLISIYCKSIFSKSPCFQKLKPRYQYIENQTVIKLYFVLCHALVFSIFITGLENFPVALWLVVGGWIEKMQIKYQSSSLTNDLLTRGKLRGFVQKTKFLKKQKFETSVGCLCYFGAIFSARRRW